MSEVVSRRGNSRLIGATLWGFSLGLLWVLAPVAKPLTYEFGMARFFPGGAVGTAFVLSGLMTIVVGRFTGREGVQWLIVPFAVVATVSPLLLSMAGSPVTVYLSVALLGIGVGGILGFILAGVAGWWPFEQTGWWSSVLVLVAVAGALCLISIGALTLLPPRWTLLPRHVSLESTVECKNCGRYNPSSARFCGNCGAALLVSVEQPKKEGT